MLFSEPRSDTTVDGRALALLLLITALGASLRFYNLDTASLWLDEAATVQFARLPWDTLWLSGFDNSPPLYYSIVKIAMSIDDSEFWIRLPSAVASTLTPPIVFLIGRRFAGTTAGLLAATLFAVSPTQLEYAQEARAYSLVTLLSAIALWGMLGALRNHSSSPSDKSIAAPLFIYLAATTASLYAHNATVFFIAAIQLGVFFLLIARRQVWSSFTASLIVLHLAMLALWTPWLWIVITELIGNGSMSWLQQPSILGAGKQWLIVQGYPTAGAFRFPADLLLVATFFLGMFLGRHRKLEITVLAAVALGIPLLIYLAGFIHPTYISRTILVSFVGTALIAAYGLIQLEQRHRVFVVPVLFGLGLYSAVQFHRSGASENQDWRNAYAMWEELSYHDYPNTALLLNLPMIAVPMLHYAQGRNELPMTFVWASTESSFAAVPLVTGDQASMRKVPAATWLEIIPQDLFLWHGGGKNKDRGKKFAAILDDAKAKDTGPRKQLVIVTAPSHNRKEGVKALESALEDAGWSKTENQSTKGVHVDVYACPYGCRIPNLGREPD